MAPSNRTPRSTRPSSRASSPQGLQQPAARSRPPTRYWPKAMSATADLAGEQAFATAPEPGHGLPAAGGETPGVRQGRGNLAPELGSPQGEAEAAGRSGADVKAEGNRRAGPPQTASASLPSWRRSAAPASSAGITRSTVLISKQPESAAGPARLHANAHSDSAAKKNRPPWPREPPPATGRLRSMAFLAESDAPPPARRLLLSMPGPSLGTEPVHHGVLKTLEKRSRAVKSHRCSRGEPLLLEALRLRPRTGPAIEASSGLESGWCLEPRAAKIGTP